LVRSSESFWAVYSERKSQKNSVIAFRDWLLKESRKTRQVTCGASAWERPGLSLTASPFSLVFTGIYNTMAIEDLRCLD